MTITAKCLFLLALFTLIACTSGQISDLYPNLDSYNQILNKIISIDSSINKEFLINATTTIGDRAKEFMEYWPIKMTQIYQNLIEIIYKPEGGNDLSLFNVLASVFSALLFIYFILTGQKTKQQTSNSINDYILTLKNKITNLEFENQAFAAEFDDNENKIQSIKQANLDQLDLINQLNQKNSQLQSEICQYSLYHDSLIKSDEILKEELDMCKKQSISKLQDYESKLEELEILKYQSDEVKSQLDQALSTINNLNHKIFEQNDKITYYDKELEHLKDSECKLKAELEEKDKNLITIQNSLDSYKNFKYSSYQVDFDGLDNADPIALNQRLQELVKMLNDSEKRYKIIEKELKQNEMQIKVLNELREKDTKQHLKSVSDLNSQLAKKSAEASKITHLLEQIKMKQERIQELEVNYSKLEKQANHDRQVYEKKVHENWLNSKKYERELKDLKNELQSLKQANEIESRNKEFENKSVKSEYSSIDHQLHIETDDGLKESDEQLTSDPSSTVSNVPTNFPGYPVMRLPLQPFRFLPNPSMIYANNNRNMASSPNPNQLLLPPSFSTQMIHRAHPLMFQQQFFQQSTFIRTSSQQPSPSGNDCAENLNVPTINFDSSFINVTKTTNQIIDDASDRENVFTQDNNTRYNYQV